jgi:chemotaxis protein MotB
MARARRQEEPENHERWLVSYADFITLLFAFFVVMFATSQADKGKAQQVSDSVKEAFEGKKMSAVIAAVLGGSPDTKGQGNAQMKGPGGAQPLKVKKDEKLAELIPSLRILSQELKTEIDSGQIRIRMEPRGLVVSFTQAAVFPSGEDLVSGTAYASLEKVAAAMAKIPNPARLEGHTDSLPIRNSQFRSNWELSAARSIALMEILCTKFGAPRDRISIAGYADTAPIAANDTEEGRAQNRRVDIIILNERGILAEPSKTVPAAAQSADSSR